MPTPASVMRTRRDLFPTLRVSGLSFLRFPTAGAHSLPSLLFTLPGPSPSVRDSSKFLENKLMH